MVKKDWSESYKKENVEIRYIKTKADLERESELLKKEKLTKCIKYEVVAKYRDVFYGRLFYGRA